jgi:hypothetical protein
MKRRDRTADGHLADARSGDAYRCGRPAPVQLVVQVAADGGLINGEPYFRSDMPEASPVSGVEGVTVDSIGHVYFADAVGIQICGRRAARSLSKPEFGNIGNSCLRRQGSELAVCNGGRQGLRRAVKRGTA